jgi:hypothetical protein
MLSTEAVGYGGRGEAVASEGELRLPARSAVLLRGTAR